MEAHNISNITNRERKIVKSLSIELALWELAIKRAKALGISTSEYICCLIEQDAKTKKAVRK